MADLSPSMPHLIYRATALPDLTGEAAIAGNRQRLMYFRRPLVTDRKWDMVVATTVPAAARASDNCASALPGRQRRWQLRWRGDRFLAGHRITVD